MFDHHLTFFGGFDAFVAQLPAIKSRCIEKKLFVEADAERARVLARAGVDGIQFDKVPVADLDPLVQELRGIDPRLTLIAAGGVNPDNAGAYAACGVDGLATTAPFAAKPLDMSVRMPGRANACQGASYVKNAATASEVADATPSTWQKENTRERTWLRKPSR